MDAIYNFLIDYGVWGMFIAAFLSGSILPFSSEAVMIALLAIGVDPWQLLFFAATGNALGGTTCYYMGWLTTPERVERAFNIKPEYMKRALQLTERWGAWIAFFGWVPLLGTAILITLGIMRANPIITNMTMAIGKTIRYVIVLLPALGVIQMFG